MPKIETEKESDGRWIAEIPSLAGAMAYGETKAKAKRRVIVLALRVIADRLEHCEPLTARQKAPPPRYR
jgi:predicted RNase H-like HicB family nuclease